MLETAFQGVNALLAASVICSKAMMNRPQRNNRGRRAGCAYQQPAGGTQRGRCTCEARVVNEPGNGAFVSPMSALAVRYWWSGISEAAGRNNPGGNRGADVSSPGQNAF